MKRVKRWIQRILKPETPLYLIGLFVAAVIIMLVAVIFWSIFQEGLPSVKTLFSFSLSNFRKVFSSPILFSAGFNTLLLGVGATIVALVVAVPLTWMVHRTNVPFKQAFITLMFLNVLLPGFIKIMGWIILLGPEVGIVNQVIRAIFPGITSGPFSTYNIPFMIFLEGISAVPVFFLMIGGAFASIDPSLEEAAETSGMNKFQVLKKISLPMLRPAIVTGAIFIFVMAVSTYELPALLGTPSQLYFFSTLMFEAIQPSAGMPQFGVAGVYAVIMLIPILGGFYYYHRMVKVGHRYTTVTGKGYRPKITDLGRWRWMGLAFVIFFFAINLFLPFLAVVWTSLLPVIQMPSISALGSINLSAYAKAVETLIAQKAIANTLILIFSVGLVGMFIGLVMSWISHRTKLPGRFLLDGIAMIPHAIPSLAIAFAVAFLSLLFVKFLPLYGSLLAIVIANLVKTTPFTTRAISASIIQIHPELEEAVQTSGASKVIALRKIIMPLITPTLMYCFIWTLLQSYREVTMPLFLISPDNMVLSTIIWTQWYGASNFDVASATSVIMIGVMSIFVLIFMWLFPQMQRARS